MAATVHTNNMKIPVKEVIASAGTSGRVWRKKKRKRKREKGDKENRELMLQHHCRDNYMD